MAASDPQRVTVVNTCPLMNDGTARCLEVAGCDVTTTLTLKTALTSITDAPSAGQADWIILGPHSDEAESFALCRSLAQQRPATRIILLVADATDLLVQADAEAAGVAACVSYAVTCQELVSMMLTLNVGYRMFSDRISLALHQAGTPSAAEQRVLTLLAGDATYAAIAKSLGLSTPTVRNHVQNLLEKFHVHTRSDLARRARRLGWI